MKRWLSRRTGLDDEERQRVGSEVPGGGEGGGERGRGRGGSGSMKPKPMTESPRERERIKRVSVEVRLCCVVYVVLCFRKARCQYDS